jgi:hypothetical protein
VKHKSLNLQTYKYHALGDYPNTIRRMGTTDNYSTQPVSITFIQRTPTYTSTTQGELQHRRSKRRFARTPKTKDKMVASIASQEAIERFCEKVITAREHLGAASKNPDQPRWRRQRTSPSDHYYIARRVHRSCCSPGNCLQSDLAMQKGMMRWVWYTLVYMEFKETNEMNTPIHNSHTLNAERRWY